MMLWIKPRLVRGSAKYWKRRREMVIKKLKQDGYIAQVGPAGQVIAKQYVGKKEAWYWWRRAERAPRFWILTLLVSIGVGVAILQLRPPERKPFFLVLVAPSLLHAGVGLVRHLRR
jgi:hypothetical protein